MCVYLKNKNPLLKGALVYALREKCPNMEFFVVRNTGKYRPEKALYLDNFHAVMFIRKMTFIHVSFH